MKPPYIRELFQYDDWANQRVIGLAASVAERDLDRPFEMGPGSIRKTLNHIWAAERVWFDRWTGVAAPFYRAEPCRAPLSALREDFTELAQTRNAYFAEKSDADVDQRVHYRTTRGEVCNDRLGELALHVFNHGIHHRAQALNMLRRVGATIPQPGLDYIFMRLESGPHARPPELDRASLKTHFHYADWARHRVHAAAAHLTDVQLDRSFEIGPGTLRKTLMHIRAAEQWWLDNWLLGPGNPFPETPETTSIAELTRLFDATVSARNAYLDRLTEADLLKPVHARPRPGVERVFPLGVTMLQMCCHGTHHRAQCLNMLRHVGGAPPAIDFMLLLREASPVAIESEVSKA